VTPVRSKTLISVAFLSSAARTAISQLGSSVSLLLSISRSGLRSVLKLSVVVVSVLDRNLPPTAIVL
jgi:hypothetical protein